MQLTRLNKNLLLGIIIFIVIVGGFLLFVSLSSKKTSQPATIQTLTNKEKGSTIMVHPNDIVSLDVTLDPVLIHSVKIDNPTILENQSTLGNFSNNKYHTTLHAKQPGTATVYIFGKPVCQPGHICPGFITQDYRVTIIVGK